LTIHHDGEVPVLSPRHPLLHVRVSSDATRSSWAIVQAGAGSRVSAPKSRYHIAFLMVSLIMIDCHFLERSYAIQDPPAIPPGADNPRPPGSPTRRRHERGHAWVTALPPAAGSDARRDGHTACRPRASSKRVFSISSSFLHF
jgi:hypothetical protein